MNDSCNIVKFFFFSLPTCYDVMFCKTKKKHILRDWDLFSHWFQYFSFFFFCFEFKKFMLLICINKKPFADYFDLMSTHKFIANIPVEPDHNRSKVCAWCVRFMAIHLELNCWNNTNRSDLKWKKKKLYAKLFQR